MEAIFYIAEMQANDLKCVPLGWIMIHQRDRWTMTSVDSSFPLMHHNLSDLGYWSWSRSFQRNAPLELDLISVYVFGSRLFYLHGTMNTVFKLGPGMHQSRGDCAVYVLSSNITRWKDAIPQIEFCDLTGSKRILLRECPAHAILILSNDSSPPPIESRSLSSYQFHFPRADHSYTTATRRSCFPK